MAELIQLLYSSRTSQKQASSSFQSKVIEGIFSNFKLQAIKENNNIYLRIDFKENCTLQQFDELLEEYHILLCIQATISSLKISFGIYSNRSGNCVRARAQAQKKSFIKFIIDLNQQENCFIFKIHPITGEIVGVSQIMFFDQKNAYETLLFFISQIMKSTHSIWAILEILQQIPDHVNRLNNFIEKSLQPSFQYLYQHKFNEVASPEEACHRRNFIVKKTNKKSVSEFDEQRYRKSIEVTLIQETEKFAKRKKLSLKQNYVDVVINENKMLIELSKNILEEEISVGDEIYQFSQFFNINGERKKFLFQPSPTSRKQYSICQNISKRRGLYLNFIYQHYFLKNYSQIHNIFYLIDFQEKKNSISLYWYLKKNALTLSFTAKMEIFCSVLAIACICQKLELKPSLSVNNIYVTHQLKLKLDRIISENSVNFKQILYQALSEIIFCEKIYVPRAKEGGSSPKKRNIFSINEDMAKFLGPSIYIIVLKHILLDQGNNEIGYISKNISLPAFLKIACIFRDLKYRYIKRSCLFDFYYNKKQPMPMMIKSQDCVLQWLNRESGLKRSKFRMPLLKHNSILQLNCRLLEFFIQISTSVEKPNSSKFVKMLITPF